MSFIFGEGTGQTYEDLQRKRDIAKILAAKRAGQAPRNTGEGLNAIGEAIAYRMLSKKNDALAGKLKGDFNSQWESVFDKPASGDYVQNDYTPKPSLDMGSEERPGYRGDTVEYDGRTYDMGQSQGDFASAIATVESGGRYDAVGPPTKNGGRAYGKYQVMDFNVGPWTEEVLGKRMTPQEFLASPKAQDAVFNAKFGSYVKEYGSPQDAASVWFSGRPLSEAGNASDGYTTVPEYVKKFTAALGQGGQAEAPAQGNTQLGMIGGVKPDGTPWQSLDASGRAHASNPNYEDYSQLFREYRFDRPDESWVQVGERDGRPVYAAPDYARDENGNYINVSAAEAQQLAQERGTVIPTRDEYRALYENANRVPMPTSADFGAEPGQGTPEQYTAMASQRMQEAGLQPGQPVVHGKEFFSPVARALAERGNVRVASVDSGPEMVAAALAGRQGQDTRTAFNFPETQTDAPLNMPFTPSQPRPPEMQQQQPQQRSQPPFSEQQMVQIMALAQNPMATPAHKAQAKMALQKYNNYLEMEAQRADPAYQLDLQRAQLEVRKLQDELERGPDMPSSVDEYEYARQQGFGGSYQDWITSREKAGAANVSTTVKTGDQPDSRPMVDKPPKGYQRRWDPERQSWVDEPIPGSEVASEESRGETKLDLAMADYDRKFGIVDSNLDKAINTLGEKGRWVAGYGSILSGLPESDARDFQATLDTIKANLGFEELQNMRDNSPTGGALGQVSEKEIAFLQAMQGNLDAAQSPEELMDVLKGIKKRRAEFRAERMRIMGMDTPPEASGKGDSSRSNFPDVSQMSVPEITAYRKSNPVENWTKGQRAAVIRRLRELRGE